jgi:hypothetical protein
MRAPAPRLTETNETDDLANVAYYGTQLMPPSAGSFTDSILRWLSGSNGHVPERGTPTRLETIRAELSEVTHKALVPELFWSSSSRLTRTTAFSGPDPELVRATGTRKEQRREKPTENGSAEGREQNAPVTAISESRHGNSRARRVNLRGC